ncbi:ABC transporter substrate-binding protein [Actibacterium mucosum KCTC 23349]|uniref:ABC transporter substrate-binding protein n=1 Tax=Actibacterium mucosum KCTC 23349 TaxID=1454373 RepID=A0A037ZF49_9RHOB|nr:zinc ABC transporter substrate-binding protein [Actibacterium mucosum]KAJ54238.1 ABC transporter substrate-binding protein [Actibacterium mucosum KCTC 23349]
MSSRRTVLKSATAIVAASFLLPGAALAEGTTPVVATFSILGDMVQRIGGEHIALTTLVGPDGDAHVYQPTPRDAAAVAAAEVLFVNGLEFEGWLERLAEAAPFQGEIVVATNGIDAIEFGDEHDDDHDEHGHEDHDDHGHEDHDEKEHDEHGHEDHDDEDHDEHDHEAHGEKDHDEHGHDDHDDEDHDEHDHHGHDHGAFDPHAWHDIDNVITYVDNITAGLAKADPENAAAFYANRAEYVAELEALDAELDELLGSIPVEKRTVVTPHDAFGYLAAHYDLTFLAPVGLSTESEASAADVAALITQIKDEGISAVFLETVADNRLIEQVANETGAAIGGTLFSDALSPADGPAGTYVDMMRHNAKTLSDALSK